MDQDPVRCDECGTHFVIAPGMVTDGLACPECGGKRLFRDQPSPTQSDGTLRDMVDSDTQADQGGNPLGEGTIMGTDGEQPAFKRDNFMHSKTAGVEYDPNHDIHKGTIGPDGLHVWPVRFTGEDWTPTHMDMGHMGKDFVIDNGYVQYMRPEDGGPFDSDLTEDERLAIHRGTGARFPRNASHSATESVMDRPETFSTDPYDTLFYDDRTLQIARRQAGIWDTIKGIGTGLVDHPLQAAEGLGMAGAGAALTAVPGVDLGPSEGLAAAGVADLGEAAAAGAAEDATAGGVGAAEDAAAQEGENAGSGLAKQVGNGVGQVAKGVGKKMLNHGIGDLMRGALGQGAGGGQFSGPSAPPSIMQMGASTKDIPMLLVADTGLTDLYQSVPSVDEQSDEPWNQDQQQFDSGDMTPSNFHNPNLEDSGNDGEDNTRTDSAYWNGFPDTSPGLERAHMVMPLLMHYYNSDESGEQDPVIRGVHEALEQEHPGYLTDRHPDSDAQLQQFLQDYRHPSPTGVHAHTAAGPLDQLPGGQPTTAPPPGQPPINSVPQPQAQGGTCPMCGGVLGPDGSCPQCGNGNNGTMVPPTPNIPGMGMQPMAAYGETGVAMQGIAAHLATHQGPVTPQQIAAVQEVLLAEGRDQEVPNVPLHPEQYAKEMAMIQNNPNVAPQVDPSQLQQTPPPAQPQAPGAMPVNDPSQAGGGAPMQPMAGIRDLLRGPEEELPEGVCPECRGRGVVEGDQLPAMCHNCNGTGRIQSPQDQISIPALSPYDPRVVNPDWAMAYAKTADANTLVPRCPFCNSGTTTLGVGGDPTMASEPKGHCHSCGKDFDIGAKQSSLLLKGEVEFPNPALAPPTSPEPHMKWADVHGDDLIPGQTYELHSPAFTVPTEIKVLDVKPDGLQTQIVGGIAGDIGAPPLPITRQEAQLEKYQFVPIHLADTSTEPDTTPGQSPEQVPPIETTDETPDVIPHSHESSFEDPSCQKCGSTMVDDRMLSPEITAHDCVHCGNHWETRDEDPGITASVDLSWINQSDDDDFGSERHQAMLQAAGNQSRNLADIAAKDARLQEIKARLDANEKLAGKHFSPSERRALIDEHGKARNLTDLDLEGTHYDTRVDYSGISNPDLVDDDHFALGL